MVAHAMPPEGIGGTEKYVDLVARGLGGRGHDVSVFCGSLEWKPEFEVQRFELDGLPITRVHRSDLYFDHWDKIQNPHVSAVWEEELARLQPDVVHVHHWIRLTFDLARRAAARSIPVAVHLHDLFLTCPRVFRIREEDRFCPEKMGPAACVNCVSRWSFQKDAEIHSSLRQYRDCARSETEAATVLLAPSTSHANYIQDQLGQETTIETLPHPAFPGREVAPGKDAQSPAGKLRLLYFSHLHPVKGPHVLLEVLRQLGPDSGVAMDFWGGFSTPEYESQLRTLAEGLDVEFHGPYEPENLSRQAADAVVIPSLARESYSFWLDEAMALGHPILAARSGALEERATGRVTLFDPRDPGELARGIEALRDHPDQRARQRSAGAAPVLGLQEHLDRLESVLRRLKQRSTSWEGSVSEPSNHFHDWDRREAAFAELLRSEGWERALGEQNREIERLQKDLAEAEKIRGRPSENS